MTIEELFGVVLDIPPDEITDATATTTVGAWTSRMHVHLIVALEDAYGVTFSAAECVALTSVGAARRLLAEKGVVAG